MSETTKFKLICENGQFVEFVVTAELLELDSNDCLVHDAALSGVVTGAAKALMATVAARAKRAKA